jgi:hypothetical protein
MDWREFQKLAGAAVGGLVAGASVLRAATTNARPEDEKSAPLCDQARAPGSMNKLLILFPAALAMLLAGRAPLPAGTIAYYRFEEGSGTAVVNSVNGHVEGSHNAAYSPDVPSGTVPQTGASNHYSLQFNGTNSAHITSQNFIFNRSYGDATLEFSVKWPDQPHSSIFWTRGDDTDANRFNIYTRPGGYFGFDYRAPDGTLHDLGGNHLIPVPLDTWADFAITRTGDTYRVWENGTLRLTTTDVNPDLPNSTSWTIAGRHAFPFTGFVDEVRFSDVALSPDQFLFPPSAVPEPLTATLLAIGTAGLAGYGTRRRCRLALKGGTVVGERG